MIMKKYLADLFILLWCIYFISQYLNLPSSIQLSLLSFIYLWSFVTLYYIHRTGNVSKLIISLDLLILMFSIYGFYYILTGEQYRTHQNEAVKSSAYLVSIYSSLLTFYPFYWYTVKRIVTLKTIRRWILLFFLIVIWGVFVQQERALELLFEEYGNNVNGEIVNNSSYQVLALLPLLTLLKKEYLKILGLLVCSYFIVISFKRGPLLILTCCFVYYYIKYYYKTSSKSSKIWTTLLLVFAILLVWHLITNVYLESEMFQFKLAKTLEGNSSGRDLIIEELLSSFVDSSFINQLFGFGANGTIKISGRLAHSDWVEILVNQGLIGVMVFSFFS